MDRELVKQWIADLRSGEFKQAKAVLHDTRDNSYCCLGVVCKRIADETGQAIKEIAVPYGYDQAIEKIKRVSLLGELGLVDTKVMFENYPINDVTRLTMMNDRGQTFAEIADHIETFILGETIDVVT